MDKKHILIWLVIILLIGGVFYYGFSKKGEEVKPPVTPTPTSPTPTTPTPTPTSKVYYKNTVYGFSIILPDSWEDFSVIEDEWEGNSQSGKGEFGESTEKGPLISVRHPDWDYKSPRQDIPIMVFTIIKWNEMQADKFHIGAAPINPTEIGRNKKYVFAIPARYNFSYLTGYEEVDQILRGDNFVSF